MLASSTSNDGAGYSSLMASFAEGSVNKALFQDKMETYLSKQYNLALQVNKRVETNKIT
jgi:hypothetical protein